MQNIRKTIKKGLNKRDKKKFNENDTEVKFPFLQRFVSETKSFKNEIKQAIKAC
jgi:hypothetical protein